MLTGVRKVALAILFLLATSISFAQNARLTISHKGATIDAILDDIEKQTDYLFIYRKGVNVMAKKSITAHNAPVSEILNKLFEGTGIKYSMEGNYIVLTQTEVKRTPKAVTGVVTDSEGNPLIGVVVSTKKSRSYALTDSMGKFSIEINNNDELALLCLGFERYETHVVPGQNLEIAMHESSEMLQETVAIGFGIQKKSDVTGAITSIEEDKFEKSNANTITAAMIGAAAGIHIITTSGDPDSIGDIRIRGLSSNSSSANNPLFIVDGLLVKNVKQINAQNIKSIEILKDAASAAIYGAQAGNGVVVITTKTGRSGAGSVFYNGSFRLESAGWRQKMMDSEQYIDYVTSAGLITPSVIMASWDGVTNTDWQKEMLPGGYAMQHNFGFEGGNERGDYYASVSYLDNDGILYGDKDRVKRLNFQFNASYKIKDWVRIGSTNTLQYKLTTNESDSFNGSDKSIMAQTYAMSPLIPLTYSENDLPDFMRDYLNNGYNLLKTPSGDYIATTEISTSIVNPLINLYKQKESVNENLDMFGTFYADLTPFNFLKFTSRIGYIINNYDNYTYEEPWYAGEQNYNQEYDLTENVKWKLRYQWDNYVNINDCFGNVHNVDFMAGMSYIEANERYVKGSTNQLKDYLPNFRYLSFSTASALDNVSGERSKEASLSYFTRLSYNYDNRYYLQGSFRADAFDTSRLSKKSRWGFFPAISAGWTISNEDWMIDARNFGLTFLKLRACWGVNGNIGVLSNYSYASTVTIGGSQYNMGTDDSLTLASYPTSLANEDLKWEESRQLDLGIDARFFNSRLSATFDYYDKNTNDLLVSLTPSYTTGQSSVYMNAGSVNNHGVELELSWQDSVGDFTYSISGNISHNKNVVTDLDPSITKISGANVDNGHKATYFQKGYPIWYFYGYKHEGVDPETGNNIFSDTDGNGKITTADMTMIGCAQPDFTYGLSFYAEYKNFDLSITGHGSQGNDIWFVSRLKDFEFRNFPELFYKEAWKAPGDVARYPRYNQILTSSYSRSSACIYDGSYFRIGQLQLGYTLPEKISNRIRAEKLRMYLSLDDYWTISKYVGFDPTTAGDNSSYGNGIDRGSYPTPKKLTLGINLTL